MIEDLDRDWARDLFDRTRGAGEPAFTVDPATLARAGDRRRRLRTLGAGSGLAGVVAATMVLAAGLGAGAPSADLGSQAGPGGAWGNRPLSDIFKYVHSLETSQEKAGHAYVPASAAADMAMVLGHLDPSFTHLVGSPDHAHDPRIVVADDTHAKQAHRVVMGSVWTDDSPRQAGELTFAFASNSGWARIAPVGAFSSGQSTAPCDLLVGDVKAPPASSTTPAQPTQWSPCSVSHLEDGSTIGSTSGQVGQGTITVVVREFADGEVFSAAAQDFTTAWQGGAPDPETVVKPTPWTEQSLVAALADPAVQAGWSPMPPPNDKGKLLLPSDYGKGWSFDTGQAAQGATGKYLYPDGCGTDQSVPVARPGSEAYYRGPLPNGVSGNAYEGEYVLRSGQAAQTMAKAKAAVESGCAVKYDPGGYGKDTAVALPAGIGDDAFAESVPGMGTVSVTVRIGDTILQTDLLNADHVRNQSWTDKMPLDLTSAADRQWLADIARSMVSRYHGSAAH